MFELQIVLRNFLVPAICAFVGCYLLSLADTRDDWEEEEPVRGHIFSSFFGALIVSVGLIVADFLQRDILHQPDQWLQWAAAEPYQWMTWLVPAVLLSFTIARLVFSIPVGFARVAWPLIVAASALLLWISLPRGSAWLDKLPMVAPWIAISIPAIACNSLAIDSIAVRGGARWNGLVVVAHFGAIAAIMYAYGSLCIWILAGIGTLMGATLVSLWKGSDAKQFMGWQLAPVVIAMEIMAATSMAAGSFYQWNDSPLWLLGIVLFLPSIVGLVDFLIVRGAGSWIRAIVAAIGSAILLGVAIYWTHMGSPT